MCVPLEVGIAGDLFDDDSADSPGLGIPSHVVTNLEYLRHHSHPRVKSIPDILPTHPGIELYTAYGQENTSWRQGLTERQRRYRPLSRGAPEPAIGGAEVQL